MGEAYLLFPAIGQLNLKTYKGKVIYRLQCSAKRLSYRRLKKGLVKTRLIIKIEKPAWLAIYT